MVWYVVFTVALIVIFGGDIHFYAKAKHPERKRHFGAFWPGSGYYAYWKFGPNE